MSLPDPRLPGRNDDEGSWQRLAAEQVEAQGKSARHIADRAAIAEGLLSEATSGDRILVMGARDDTLIDFARSFLEKLGS